METRAEDKRGHADGVYPPGWYVIADVGEVPRGKPVTLERFGTKLVVWRRRDGALAALSDRCPHRGASLGLGELDGDAVACPFHGFAFEASGRCVRLPVLGPDAKIPQKMCVPSFEVREADGWVWLWWGERDASKPLPEVPSFPHLRARHRYRTVHRTWDASFVRVIENQLDPFHLPFVHRTTIGRGMEPAMEVHHVSEEGGLLVYVGPERRDPRGGFHLDFRWPNLWENHIAPRFSIVAAFVPISETRTRTYLRAYQAFVTVPVLGWLVDLLMIPANDRVFSQDRRVVESQPQRPWLPKGEVLVKADNAIAAYRKMFAAALRRGVAGAPVEHEVSDG
jgi:phenylpropionate dioxygenase-like ring-hydroxylating dioxygenase large terminal subunit